MLKFLGTIEAKVWAAAGGGSILSGFLLWLLGYLAFGGSTDATKAQATAEAVPAPVALFVVALAAALAGYAAPHTARTTDTSSDESEPTPVFTPVTDPVVSSAPSNEGDPVASDTLAQANAIFPATPALTSEVAGTAEVSAGS